VCILICFDRLKTVLSLLILSLHRRRLLKVGAHLPVLFLPSIPLSFLSSLSPNHFPFLPVFQPVLRPRLRGRGAFKLVSGFRRSRPPNDIWCILGKNASGNSGFNAVHEIGQYALIIKLKRFDGEIIKPRQISLSAYSTHLIFPTDAQPEAPTESVPMVHRLQYGRLSVE